MSTIALKIECECGQHYAFDVKPVDGQMPVAIACPVCGADGTAIANEMLAGTAESELQPAGSIAPSVRLAPRPANQTPPRPIRVQPSPAVEEAKRDFLEAKLDTKRAGYAALILAGLDIGLLPDADKAGSPEWWILGDIAVVLGLAYGIYRFSRTCAVIMCIYYLAVFILMIHSTGITFLILRGIFLYYFARGAQATFEYHRLKSTNAKLEEA